MFPLSYYTQTDMNPLCFHVLDVGEGLMALLIFPDETTMLYDCNVTDDDEETITKYLSKNIPFRRDDEKEEDTQWIDIYVNSHRDIDHYRGLKVINDEYEIKSIWDSGQSGDATDDADYQYYMRLRRNLIDKHGNEAVVVPIPQLSPLKVFGSAKIYCLSSKEGFFDQSKNFRETTIQHTNAIVLSVQYAGRSILLTSDSDWKAWRENIVPNFKNSRLLESNILVVSHHGSRSFFTNEQQNDTIDPEANPDTTYIESIDFIKPSISLISCGSYNEQHHPNKDALKLYKKATPNEQVYTTYNKGSFVGLIDQLGNWTVAPSRFKPTINSGLNFYIGCQVTHNDNIYIAKSGDDIPIGSMLKFSVHSKGGTIEPFESIKVYWEVSNGGIDFHHDQQEIYYKRDDEEEGKLKFKREVAYKGRHLLRCRLINKKKKVDITKIFVVNGVEDET